MQSVIRNTITILAVSQISLPSLNAISLSEEAISQGFEAEYTCSFDPYTRTLRYVGDTDSRAINCFTSYRDDKPTRLIVTSTGGDADTAMAAANIIDQDNWTVEVRGICGSSCANYWVPSAAELTVEPYSFIAVHGAPNGLIYNIIAPKTAKRHREFVIKHEIGHNWFGNRSLGSAIGNFFGKNKTFGLLIGPCHLKKNIPNLRANDFWWPSDSENFSKFQMFVEKHVGGVRVSSCDKPKYGIVQNENTIPQK